MFDRFTERVRKVIQAAREEAILLNHDYLGTEHLLLALAKQSDCIAAIVISQVGLNADDIEREIRELVEPGPSKVSASEIPFSVHAKTAMELAVEQARTFGHNYVGTEHLLSGLIKEGEGVAARVFSKVEIDEKTVLRAIVGVLGGLPAKSVRSGSPGNFVRTTIDLSHLPGVDKVKQTPKVAALLAEFNEAFVTGIVRQVIDELRSRHVAMGTDVPPIDLDTIEKQIEKRVRTCLAPPLRHVINGTGVIVHTNLGRSILGDATVAAIVDAARHYCDVEIDLDSSERGHRDSIIEPLLCALTGAEAATVVNNNAGAVMIALDTLARGGEVIVSRGELVEIGGSFRIPDVMKKSGAKLVEVGATNRTYISDYERALTPETSLLLKVHQSNYSIVGFTREVTLTELTVLGRKRGIPVMEDLGSGALVDLAKFGLDHEPMPQESIAAGADIVCFSGDKLLGGPQAGIILGKSEHIRAIRKNPLMRALRVDKLTLAALAAVVQTLLSSPNPEKEIPTLGMLARSVDDIAEMIEKVRAELGEEVCRLLGATVMAGESQVGGGSCPGQILPTTLLVLKPENISPNKLAAKLRKGKPSILGIIRDDSFCLDFRTVRPDELPSVVKALRDIAP